MNDRESVHILGLKNGQDSESFEEAISKIKLTSEYYLTARDMELVYDYQQKKIDELELSFKNFHKNLCERFGYYHDKVDYQRDLASLEEYIAQKLQASEEENKILLGALNCEKVALLHNYFRGVLSIESNDLIQRKEDKELFDFTLKLKQALEKTKEQE